MKGDSMHDPNKPGLTADLVPMRPGEVVYAFFKRGETVWYEECRVGLAHNKDGSAYWAAKSGYGKHVPIGQTLARAELGWNPEVQTRIIQVV